MADIYRIRALAKRFCIHLSSGSKLEIHRIKLTKAKLSAMPPADRALLLLLGHACNEINVLSKLILMMRKDESAIPQFVDHVEAGQVFAIMRVLIGKLHEAWELFKTRVQSDAAMRAKYLTNLPPQATAALKQLNGHFGQGSPLTAIRNKLSFHYKDDENLIESNFQKLPDSEPWEFYLSKTVGNSFYYAAELVVSRSVIELANAIPKPPDTTGLSPEAQAFAGLCNIIVTVSGQTTELFGTLIGEIVAQTIGLDVTIEIENLSGAPKISEFVLPYFFDEDDSLPSKPI